VCQPWGNRMADQIDAVEASERLWTGQRSPDELPPWSFDGDLVEVAPDTGFIPSFGNVTAMVVDGELLLVDTGSPVTAGLVHQRARSWTSAPLHTAVFSHGHIDHVFGTGTFEEEAAANGDPAPRVVAHAALPARFDRYVRTAGYNAWINRRQFGIPDLEWPTDYRYPDITYDTTLTIEVGGTDIELHHARGETDDHTWTWVPERRVLCSGDLFIWATPNAGNPQKVQRYPREWAVALRAMVSREPDVLLPGHGLPILGADRIKQALTDAADLLDSLEDQTVELMNAGATLDEIVHTVRAPAHLLDRPYLRPVYDEPEFIVRNIWRLYGGWYDGNPATLKPAPDSALAAEVAALAGGAARLADRAKSLADDGDLRLAGHLAQMAAMAAPDDPQVQAAKAAIYRTRADAEASTMAKGIFNAAAVDAETQGKNG
jgi:alkyl sulfatase BDS1-like metallo-beta-lactamase superfamily hydrolase